MSGKIKLWLFLLVIVVPALMASVTANIAFSRAQSVEFCGSCHVMQPWIDNVTGEESDSLAGEHYKRRWIQREQCYTCHTNYGFLGPLEAKIKGVRHVIAFYIGEDAEIELYEEYPNENCLHCHLDAKGFREDSNHDPLEDILSGKDRCVECHENVHGVEQPGYEDEEPAEDEEAEDEEAEDEADEGEAGEPSPGNGGGDKDDGGGAQ
ncbi:MAG: NapC/NirT family cytochrome c [Candidatus Binatia bacterium]